MSQNFTCIKPGCGKVYQSEDEEPYYCPECLTAKQKIAQEVDRKMAGRVTIQPKSDLQLYDEMASNSQLRKGGVAFVNAKDLGL